MDARKKARFLARLARAQDMVASEGGLYAEALRVRAERNRRLAKGCGMNPDTDNLVVILVRRSDGAILAEGPWTPSYASERIEDLISPEAETRIIDAERLWQSTVHMSPSVVMTRNRRGALAASSIYPLGPEGVRSIPADVAWSLATPIGKDGTP